MNTETTTREQEQLRLARRLARDLREIAQLCRWLRVEAWHRHDSRAMPGGDAMVMLGPVATLSTWSAKVDRAERIYFEGQADGIDVKWTEIYELDTDPIPPLLWLADWEDIVRAERNQQTQWPATIERAVDYLRDSIVWLVGDDLTGRANFLPVDALAFDLAKLRRRLEAVLHDGPDDRTVPCIRCTGDDRGRLEPIWGEDIEGEDDHWHCDRCGALLTRVDYRRALAAAHRLTATALCASDIATEYGVGPTKLRKWAERGHVRTHGFDSSRRQTYNVEDVLRRRDLTDAGQDGKFKAADEYDTQESAT